MNLHLWNQLPANTPYAVSGILAACAFALVYYMVCRLARQGSRSSRPIPANATVDDFIVQGYGNLWTLIFHALIVTTLIWQALQSLLS